jgi:cofilin
MSKASSPTHEGGKVPPPEKFDPAVSDEPLYRQCIKVRKTHKYVLYKSFGDNFCVEDLGNDDYNDFLTRLPPNECRYAVYNFPYTKEATKKCALVFIMWVPDSATRANRKLFMLRKDWFTKKLFGIQLYIDATNSGMLKQFRVLQKVVNLA